MHGHHRKIKAKGNANEKLLPHHICKVLPGNEGNMEVDMSPLQVIMALRGLLKHALGRKLLFRTRVIATLRTLAAMTLIRTEKQMALEILLFT